MRENESGDWLLPVMAGDTAGALRREAAARIAGQGFAALLVCATPDAALPPPAAEERAEAARHGDPAGFLLRRRLARALLAPLLACPAAAIRIGCDPGGAPRIVAPESGMFLSFSARGGISALAIARQPVGIDLEPLCPAPAIPWNLLRGEEKAALLALPEPAHAEAFLRLWTAKEAVAKALRSGFALPPEALRIEADGTARRRNADGGWEKLPIRRYEARQVCGAEPLAVAAALLSSPASSFMRGGKSQETA